MTEQAIILHSLFLMKTWTFRQRLVTDYDFIQLVNFMAWSANYVCIFHRIPDIAQQSFTSLWFALTEQDKSNFQTDPETGTPPPVLSLHREKVPRRMCVFLYSAVGVCGILRCGVNMGVGGEARTTDPAIALCRLLLLRPGRMLHLIANLNWMPIFFHNLLSTACRAIYHVHVSSTHIIGCSTLYWSVSCIQFISLLGKIEFESHKVVSPRNISRAQQHFPKYKIH